MIPIMAVYGTRPEAIKMAPVIRALQASSRFRPIVTVTGQHREILDQVNDLFRIVPDHDLNLIAPRQSLSHISASILTGLDEILAVDRPAALLVQGDTSSATAAAITAAYHQIPVVHIEAGLRSGDLSSPFPEELNRKMISQVASLHLAPTEANRAHLAHDGVEPGQIAVTGNTVIDALMETAAKHAPFTDPRLTALVNDGSPILLATVHRRENLGAGITGIAAALARIAGQFPAHTVVLPMHPNPAVRDVLQGTLSGVRNILLIEPLDYAQFTHLMSRAILILTDSGGVQEEAPAFGKPVLVLRDTTERPEAVHAGSSLLVGTGEDDIVRTTTRLLTSTVEYESMARVINPYGDGCAAIRTVAAIEQLLGIGERLPDFSPAGPALCRPGTREEHRARRIGTGYDAIIAS